MINAACDYIKHEIIPRYKSMFLSFHFLMAVVGSACFPLIGSRWEIKASELSSAILAYSSIAVGFCLTSFTLAITFPNPKFIDTLSKSTIQKTKEVKNAYTDLLFVFSWTAISHWILVFIFLIVLIFWPKDSILYHYSFHWLKKITVLIGLGFAIYSVFQFLITLITLSQVGRVYNNWLQSGFNNKEA